MSSVFFKSSLLIQLHLTLWLLKTVLFYLYCTCLGAVCNILFIVDFSSNLSPSLHRWPCLCEACTLWWPCFWVVSSEVSSCWVQSCPSCCCRLLGIAGSQIASSLLGSPCLWCVHQLSLYLASFCVPDGLRLPVFHAVTITTSTWPYLCLPNKMLPLSDLNLIYSDYFLEQLCKSCLQLPHELTALLICFPFAVAP